MDLPKRICQQNWTQPKRGWCISSKTGEKRRNASGSSRKSRVVSANRGRSGKMSENIPVDQEHCLVFAMRYAIKRDTSAPDIVCREITEKLPQIRDWTIIQIKREIDAARGDIPYNSPFLTLRSKLP
jgi:hypothetical protein